LRLYNFFRWDELELTESHFGVITMTHLKTGVTTSNLAERREWKWIIVQRIYENNWVNKDIINVFNMVNTMITLPELAQAEFSQNS
jgi:hypothetical protein